MSLNAATAQHSIDAGTSDLGDTWILPPTLTLQYHFTSDEKFSPYIGPNLVPGYFPYLESNYCLTGKKFFMLNITIN